MCICVNCVAMGDVGGQAKDWIPAPQQVKSYILLSISRFPCSIFLSFYLLSLLLPTCCEVLHLPQCGGSQLCPRAPFTAF